MRGLILICVFVISAVFSFAQTMPASASKDSPNDLNSGILYGENYSYALTAPKDWVLDSESGASKGLAAVFYPKDSTWGDSPVWMYTSTSFKDIKNQDTLQKMIDVDVTNYRDNRKTQKIIDAPSITTKDKKTKAIVKCFLGDINGNYEACAYIDEPTVVVFIVITSPNKKGFEANLSAFNDLVSSYFYMTNHVSDK